MIVKSENNLHIGAPHTYLSNAEQGTTVLRWKNPSGFSPSWAIQIGETRNEQSEVRVLSTGNPSGGTAGTVTSATSYEHPADTLVYAIKYDQVVFERNTGGTTGGAGGPAAGGGINYLAKQSFYFFFYNLEDTWFF